MKWTGVIASVGGVGAAGYFGFRAFMRWRKTQSKPTSLPAPALVPVPVPCTKCVELANVAAANTEAVEQLKADYEQQLRRQREQSEIAARASNAAHNDRYTKLVKETAEECAALRRSHEAAQQSLKREMADQQSLKRELVDQQMANEAVLRTTLDKLRAEQKEAIDQEVAKHDAEFQANCEKLRQDAVECTLKGQLGFLTGTLMVHESYHKNYHQYEVLLREQFQIHSKKAHDGYIRATKTLIEQVTKQLDEHLNPEKYEERMKEALNAFHEAAKSLSEPDATATASSAGPSSATGTD